MRIIVTAGPTREYIDTVRFITNASSGRMGISVASAGLRAGYGVTLLMGPVGRTLTDPELSRCTVVPFTTAGDLLKAIDERFDACDALIMAAAVGDFRPERTYERKLSRSGDPVTLRLVPTDDILEEFGRRKRADQKIVAFALQEGSTEETETGARDKLIRKNADFIVVNTPPAISAAESHACILSPEGFALPWATRAKSLLAEEIVKLLS